MRKNLSSLLAAGLAVGTFAFASPATAQENDLKPHEQVQEYLDPYGVAREEFRIKHYLFRDNKNVLHYNRSYDFEGKPFIEQYVLIDPEVLPNKKGISNRISDYPLFYFFEGVWYFDPYLDGFNGNEMVHEGGAIKEPEPKTANEEKCGSRKSGFCV